MPLSPSSRDPIATDMDNPAIVRLDAAITRVERVIDGRRAAAAELERRHAKLKATMAEAVAALDEIIANKGGSGDPPARDAGAKAGRR